MEGERDSGRKGGVTAAQPSLSELTLCLVFSCGAANSSVEMHNLTDSSQNECMHSTCTQGVGLISFIFHISKSFVYHGDGIIIVICIYRDC